MGLLKLRGEEEAKTRVILMRRVSQSGAMRLQCLVSSGGQSVYFGLKHFISNSITTCLRSFETLT